ncbi:MAG: hypothetical protein NT056_03050 [Proteobacteria bacterium]|nr:hypothetical protein [Pseudomonadota bacterium]
MGGGKARFSGLILFSFLSALTCSGGQISDPSGPGLFLSGKAVYDWHDETRDRALPTSIWYPARPDGTADRSHAPYPLILFSHGSGGNRDNYTFITAHLATHGFVVAACDHQGNVGLEQFIPAEPYMAIKRPQDLSFILDRILESAEGGDQLLSGLIDPERVGAAGHSFGGYTTLVLAGASPKVDEFHQLCNGPSPTTGCGFLDFPDQIPEQADHRIRAGLTLAPALNELWGENMHGAGSVAIPIMIMGGNTDLLVPRPELEELYPALPSNPKFYVQVIGGGHDGFTDAGNLGGSLGPERMWEIVRTYAVAFFLVYLAGEKGYQKYLTPDSAAAFGGSPADFDFFRDPE